MTISISPRKAISGGVMPRGRGKAIYWRNWACRQNQWAWGTSDPVCQTGMGILLILQSTSACFVVSEVALILQCLHCLFWLQYLLVYDSGAPFVPD